MSKSSRVAIFLERREGEDCELIATVYTVCLVHYTALQANGLDCQWSHLASKRHLWYDIEFGVEQTLATLATLAPLAPLAAVQCRARAVLANSLPSTSNSFSSQNSFAVSVNSRIRSQCVGARTAIFVAGLVSLSRL